MLHPTDFGNELSHILPQYGCRLLYARVGDYLTLRRYISAPDGQLNYVGGQFLKEQIHCIVTSVVRVETAEEDSVDRAINLSDANAWSG